MAFTKVLRELELEVKDQGQPIGIDEEAVDAWCKKVAENITLGKVDEALNRYNCKPSTVEKSKAAHVAQLLKVFSK